MKLDIGRLIEDLGGHTRVSALTGVARTAPYGWVKRGYIGSPHLERIKEAHPNLDLNWYFSEKNDAERSTGTAGEGLVDLPGQPRHEETAG